MKSIRTASAARLLPLVLFLTLPAAVQAQFTFVTNNGAITITGYTGAGGDVVIPETTNGLPVTTIGNSAFLSCTNLASVLIPNSVTNLGGESFRSCSTLTNVVIGTNVISIGDQAFRSCTSLRNVNIPRNVTSIGDNLFHSCSNLTAITVDALNPVYSSVDGVLFNESQTTLIQCPGGRAGSYTIPNSVTNIGKHAFLACAALTNVTVPNHVTRIGQAAFLYCYGLTSVIIGSRVTVIEIVAFSWCTSLTAIYFEGNAPWVGSGVFAYVSSNSIAYYLPGTAGWDQWVSPPPATLWKPLMLTSDDSFGVRSNQFGFNISWASGMTVAVDACTNMANPVWTPLQTNTLTSDALYFSDPQWTNHPARFYRLRWP